MHLGFSCLVGLGCQDAPPALEAPASPVASVEQTSGWGALFWQNGRAMQVGQGEFAMSPTAVGAIQATEAQAPCGHFVEGAPQGALITVAAKQMPSALPQAPANLAGLVEAAGWRLDETLPPADAFTPTGSTAPAQQRGVVLGSVVKVKRTLAPPVLIGSGTRACQGALVVMDRKATKVLSSVALSDRCSPIKVLPPADLDGDGATEVVAYSSERTEVYRLSGSSQAPTLNLLGSWRCSAVMGEE